MVKMSFGGQKLVSCAQLIICPREPVEAVLFIILVLKNSGAANWVADLGSPGTKQSERLDRISA